MQWSQLEWHLKHEVLTWYFPLPQTDKQVPLLYIYPFMQLIQLE